MTSIKDRINEEVKNAMRAKEKERLTLLRMILAEFKQIEVDERIVLDETRELAVLDKMQKQRRESLEQFKAAKRDDLAQKEQFEIDEIQKFKPTPLTEAEIAGMISKAIADINANSMQDMAKVMAQLKPQLQGRADMSQVSVKIKELLTK